ncbi:hypothetical protein [Micromonospora sp. NPDC048947]|uniref:hypothetical protein n=1 Tax=Micromonospora sp. NPDC048947 TaxID=3154826 RepID=UPI0033D49ACD
MTIASAPLFALLRSREEFGKAELPLLTVKSEVGVELRDMSQGRSPSEDLSKYRVVRGGDLVVNRLWARFGAYGVSRQSGIISPAYWVFQLEESRVHPGFLHYLLRSAPYRGEIDRVSKNMPPNGYELPWERFRRIEVELPAMEEQWRIADFLDAETARIDRLVELKLGQARLLDARKQGLISELSEHLIALFGVVQLRHVMLEIEQGWSPQCEERAAGPNEWGVIKAGCVNGGKFIEEQHKTLPADVAPRIQYRLRSGDLLMSRASGSVDLIGSVAVVPDHVRKLLLCDKIYRLRVDPRLSSAHFLAFMLRSHTNRERIKLGISGAEGMANNLPTAVVKSCIVPAAPLDVQERSAVELQRDISAIEELQHLIAAQVSLLMERRQALITAAVTGQFDMTTGRGADLS